MQNSTQNKPTNLVLWIIWGALNMSQLIYVFLCFFVRKEPVNATVPEQLQIAGTVIAFTAGLISLFVYRTKLSREKINQEYQANGDNYIRTIFQHYIVCWALNEVICIGGFIITFVGGGPVMGILPFFGTGVFLNLIMAPFSPRRN